MKYILFAFIVTFINAQVPSGIAMSLSNAGFIESKRAIISLIREKLSNIYFDDIYIEGNE
jgi:hypothetical protein